MIYAKLSFIKDSSYYRKFLVRASFIKNTMLSNHIEANHANSVIIDKNK